MNIKKFFADFERNVSRLFFICMLSVVLLQTFSRYLFNLPLGWTEEVARFSYVWLTFIGAGYCVKSKTNIRMTVILDKFPVHIQQRIRLFGNTVVSLMFIYIFPSALKFTSVMMIRISPSLGIPMFYVYLAVVFGIIIIFIRLNIESFQIYKEIKEANKIRVKKHMDNGGA